MYFKTEKRYEILLSFFIFLNKFVQFKKLYSAKGVIIIIIISIEYNYLNAEYNSMYICILYNVLLNRFIDYLSNVKLVFLSLHHLFFILIIALDDNYDLP
jgi:hypothetical protein